MFFCVKAAIFISQLFVCLCWEEEQPGPSDLPGFGPFPTWSEQVPWANGGKSPQPFANEFILPFLKSKQDQLTLVTQQYRLTSAREFCCFCSACFTLSQSQEVQGVEEDKNQVYENI